VRQYLLCAILVSCIDIPHGFHPMHCTMPKFNMPHSAQKYVCTIDYTVARQLILILCTHQPTPLCFAILVHPTCTLLCVFSLRNAKFSVCIHTQYSSVRHHNLPCTPIRQHFLRSAKIFHGRSVTCNLVTSKLIFYEYLLQLNLSNPSRLSVGTKYMIPYCNVPNHP
jgi:hypothetical protein